MLKRHLSRREQFLMDYSEWVENYLKSQSILMIDNTLDNPERVYLKMNSFLSVYPKYNINLLKNNKERLLEIIKNIADKMNKINNKKLMKQIDKGELTVSLSMFAAIVLFGLFLFFYF